MALKLSFDVTTGNLVTWQGSSAALPPFGQCSSTIELRFVRPATSSLPGATTYEAITLTDYLGPRIGIWSSSTFTSSDSDTYVLALAVHTDFTLNEDDADDPYYTGTFNTDTEEIAALGSDKTTAAYFACGLVRTADLAIERVYDHKGATNCTVYSATDDGSGTLPASAAGATRLVPLPLSVEDVATGEVYELTRTAEGVLTWVWTNP